MLHSGSAPLSGGWLAHPLNTVYPCDSSGIVVLVPEHSEHLCGNGAAHTRPLFVVFL